MLHSRLLIAVLAFSSTGAQAQWLNYSTPGTPRLKDGKPNLAAPTPEALDGKPDLSGVWLHETTTVEDVKRIFGHRFDGEIAGSIPGMEIGTQHKYFFDIFADFKPGEPTLTPEAAERRRKMFAERDPSKVCAEPVGLPFAALASEPFKIVQSPRVTIVLYETGGLNRQIFTDGRTLPKEFDLPAYVGYSVGHWERDVFLVETAGFNNRGVMDWSGHFHSEALRLTERFHRRDFGHLDVEMTFDDPNVFARPIPMKVGFELLADSDIFEMFCDNEKDAKHMMKNDDIRNGVGR
jgi:hypothetical protein